MGPVAPGAPAGPGAPLAPGAPCAPCGPVAPGGPVGPCGPCVDGTLMFSTSQVVPFATFINGVTKYVATSKPLDLDWPAATAIDGGLVEFVRDLKDRPGGDIGVHASISVARTLLAADVVDALKLVIAPVIAGSGRRFLDGMASTRLELIRSVSSPSGNLLVDYRVVR